MTEHEKSYVYLDHAATTPVDPFVFQAMEPYFSLEYGNPSSTHPAGRAADKAVTQARESVARLLNAKPREIFFTGSGSEADNQAIISAAGEGKKNRKMHLVTTAIEHHAVLVTMKALEAQGYQVTYVQPNSAGVVEAEKIAAAIRKDTCFVSVMRVNNEIGTLQPATEIAEICRQKGILCHTDAVQAAGHMNINFATEKYDYLSLSGHKFNGPKGVGVLVAKEGSPLYPLILGGRQERGMRAGTLNVPAIVGLAKALELNLVNLSSNLEKVSELAKRLRQGLAAIPGIRLTVPAENTYPGIVHCLVEGKSAEVLLWQLNEKGICASQGSACEAGAVTGSHVLEAIGLNKKEAAGALRFSLSSRNTAEEIEYVLRTLQAIVGK